MALVQMHNYSHSDKEIKELNDRVEQLKAKLQSTENELVLACQQRDSVLGKVKEAVQAIEQRDNSIRKIEEQVKLLHTLAESLKKENVSVKSENENLNASLKNTQDELAVAIRERDKLQSHDDILEKMDEVEEELSKKLAKLRKDEEKSLDILMKQVNKPVDQVYRLKVLGYLNTIDHSTSRLRNYNDQRAMSKLDSIEQGVANLTSNNKVGLLCAFSVVLGTLVGAFLMKLL